MNWKAGLIFAETVQEGDTSMSDASGLAVALGRATEKGHFEF